MLRTGKHQALVDDPVIRYKSVESLPGIGPVYGRRLRDAGFDTADKVLAQYLTLNRNENRFTLWLNLASGANSRYAAQCFSGLDEWYHTWGKEAHIPKIKKASSTLAIQNPYTNRMLLEQKILQFNITSSDNRLRSLTNCQALSLFDISRPQGNLPEILNKSQPNISNGLTYDFGTKNMKNGKCHSLVSLMSPTQKSVNFKENEIIQIGSPRKFPIPTTSPTRNISPILKSRSITPENKISTYSSKNNVTKSLNIPCEPRAAIKKLNNLNSNYNTYTKKAPVNRKETGSVRGPCMTSEKSLKNKTSKQNGQETYQNIEKYFDEVQSVNKNGKISKPKTDGLQDSLSTVSTKSDDFQNQFSALDTTTEEQIITTESNVDLPRSLSPILQLHAEQETSHEDSKNNHKKEIDNSNEDSALDVNTNTQIDYPNESNDSDDEFSFGTSIDLSSTGSNEQLSRVLSPALNNRESYYKSDLIDNFDEPKTNLESSDHKIESKGCTSFSEANFDNSNEDSGLDVNTNGLIEFPNESVASDDERSIPFENIDSLSSGSSTDRTYEVNETTDAESAFNFIASSSTISNAGASKNKGKDQADTTDSTYDDAKRTNVRLFCDMLSSDLEQLPMDKFRKLKLKILQLVYAEIDECGSK